MFEESPRIHRIAAEFALQPEAKKKLSLIRGYSPDLLGGSRSHFVTDAATKQYRRGNT
jgi:hypothetical protein